MVFPDLAIWCAQWHFSATFEIGAAYGPPRVALKLEAPHAILRLFCRSIASDPTIQSN